MLQFSNQQARTSNLLSIFSPFACITTMPPMKIQPIDSPTMRESLRAPDSTKPVFKSRLRRLFDRQFPGVLRVSTAEKQIVAGCEAHVSKDCAAAVSDFEPSSLCLANMVQNFIEESNDKQSVAATAAKCGRNRCNCFNGNNNDSSDGEFDFWSESASNPASYGDLIDAIKSLVPCTSMIERNLLADTAKIVEQQSKSFKRKDELRKIVTDGLSASGYDASICKSRWEKSSSYPAAGEYEYIDVVVAGGGGERLLIDVDFRSEFEIARSTGTYKTILQSLPFIFVGKGDRLEQIVSAVSEAAKQSLKKKGMHIPPWRKAEYMRAKWLSPYTRATPSPPQPKKLNEDGDCGGEKEKEEEDSCTVAETEIEAGEFELIFGEESSSDETNSGKEAPPLSVESCCRGKKVVSVSPAVVVVHSPWKPPALRPRSSERGGGKVVTGLASLLREKL